METSTNMVSFGCLALDVGESNWSLNELNDELVFDDIYLFNASAFA